MSNLPPMELIEDRVDWITATTLLDKTTDGSEFERANDLAAKMLRQEESAGNKMRRGSFFGFDGLQSGQVFVGRSKRGYLFRLSGERASEWWEPVYELSTNVSRLDVAATFRLTSQWSDLTRIHHEEAIRYQREHNPRLRVTRIDGGKHGNTLTIGSRSSDIYVRCYDKEAESKREEYQDCWRYEAELKRDVAVHAAELLSRDQEAKAHPFSVASGWVGRVLETPYRVPTVGPVRRGFRTRSDDDDSLLWLRTGVRRSVERLSESGRLLDVLRALGIDNEALSSIGYTRVAQSREEV